MSEVYDSGGPPGDDGYDRPMQVVSVNVGRARPVSLGKTTRETGIHKRPVQEAIRIGVDGLVGDAVCDVRHHGGLDQAVYVYGAADYAWWSAELGEVLEPGTFGENLTIGELECSRLKVGDSLCIGAVELQVTAPRIPCGTLAARMGDPGFVGRFRDAERPGVYCRVLKEGSVRAGERVVVEPFVGDTIPVLELFRAYYEPAPSEAELRRLLLAPLASRARRDTEAKLQKLVGPIAAS